MIERLKLMGSAREYALVFDIMNTFRLNKCIISHSVN